MKLKLDIGRGRPAFDCRNRHGRGLYRSLVAKAWRSGWDDLAWLSVLGLAAATMLPLRMLGFPGVRWCGTAGDVRDQLRLALRNLSPA